MKALILAAGRGNRLNEITKNKNKCMVGVDGKPILEYNVKRAADIGEINEIIIVVGWKAEDIINYFGNEYCGKRIKYIIQNDQKGLVDAIECSKEPIGGEDFFLLLGDEFLTNTRHKEFVKKFRDENLFGLCGVVRQKDKDYIKRTYSVISDDEGNVFRMIEKPRKILNDMQGTGHCLFRNEIFDFINFTPIHHERKEKELPDLIQCAIDDGEKVKIFEIGEDYVNINNKDDIRKIKSSDYHEFS